MTDRTDTKLDEMRQRYERASEACRDLYDMASEDEKFVTVPGAQWDTKLKARRGDRPMYEFPKLAGHVRQVINEMRQARPQGKVRGTEESDKGLAELMQGICRNIESVSNAEQAYDIAFEKAVKGGFGVWRICTDYARDEDFELDIFIEAARNPRAVKFDPAARKIDKRDAQFAFVEELIPRTEFQRKYPDASLVDFDADGSGDLVAWREAGMIRIAEYWYKEPKKRRLLALSDGRVLLADQIAKEAGIEEGQVDGLLLQMQVQVEREREVDGHIVRMRLTNGHQWLTEPYDFPSKFIPLVPVYGNIEDIDGDDYWQGMVRSNKDMQRLHNVHRTAVVEAVAKSPKAPFITKLKWIKGMERFWKNANSEDYPYLPVNDEAEAMPQRATQAEVPVALMQLAQLDNEDIKAGTGQFNASIGATSNETSGKAINARKQQGAVATFNYIDNLAYSIKYTYEILTDMVPQVYDTPRVVRVLGPDGGEKWKSLYQEVLDPATGQVVVLNDIRKGKYDITMTVGPSFATQRMEAVDAFTQMLGQMGPGLPPAIAALMAYMAVKNMDLPGGEDVDAAFRKMLVAQGVMEPKEGDQPPPPPQPNPKDITDAKKSDAQAQLYGAQAQGQELENIETEQRLQAQQILMGLPPPMQPPPAEMPMPDQMQPPQGGFSLPETTGGMPA